MEPYEEIHLAKNIDALDLLAKLDKPIGNKKVEQLCRALEQLYKSAQQNPLNQERTYILLYRFLYLLNIQMKKDNFFEIRFQSDYERAKVQFEEIRKSLIERYDVKFGQETSITPKEKSPVSQTKIFTDKFISCFDLYSALKTKPNILLVDARPSSDFTQSHVIVNNIINVPEECIISGLSANMLGKRLPPETQLIWDKRDSYSVLILFDWNTTSENLNSTKLDKLYSALVDWDLNRNYSEQPVILNGGYLELLQIYPTICTNPHILLSKKNNELDDLLDIDNIEYPTETDNKILVMGNVSQEQKKQSYEKDTDKENEKSREILIKENKDISVLLNDKINILIQKEEEWKVTNDLLKDESNNKHIKTMECKAKKLEDDILKLEKQINELEEKRDTNKRDFELYANFNPKKETIKTDEISEIIKFQNDDNEKLKIIDTIAEERNIALKKARSVKPKTIDKPVINRATKPIPVSHLLVDPIEYLTAGKCGMKNINNTCYMNTIVQCIRNIPIIMEFFCSGNYAKHVVKKPAAIIYESAYLIRLLWSKLTKFIEPIEFYKKVCALEPNFSKGHHEDCMEFFLFLINLLHEDCACDVPRPEVMTPKQMSWYNQFQGKSSIFSNLFYHQIRIKQKCNTCSHTSYKFEIENSFMLSVPEYEFSLEHLMDDYMADFIIPEYLCVKCKKPVLNSKSVVFQPRILVIVLKRYKQGPVVNNYPTFVKKISRVNFPKDNFKFGKSYYTLNSVALHSGNVNSGHYTAASLMDDGWFEFNDEVSKPINVNDDSFKVKACAFFYSICDEVNINTLM